MVILTHFHEDHIGGFYEIIDKVKISKVITNLILPRKIMNGYLRCHDNPFLSSVSIYKDILKKLEALSIPLEVIDDPYELIINDFNFKILTPRKTIIEEVVKHLSFLDIHHMEREVERLHMIDRSLNSTSLTVLLSKSERKVALITSDADLEYWDNYTMEIRGVDILQAPHHGDIKHISPSFIRHVFPKYFIVSADAQGTYNLPHEAIKDVVRENSEAEIYYTEEKGTDHKMIRINIDTMDIQLIK